jgi:dicarboxylate transporter 10
MAGVLGGASGNPSDVVNVRMQNDGQLPPNQRRNYKNVIDGMIRICREEGPKALCRGLGSSTYRAVLITVSQMTSYDMFKDGLIHRFKFNDDLMTHFTSSLLAVSIACATCCADPFCLFMFFFFFFFFLLLKIVIYNLVYFLFIGSCCNNSVLTT